MLKKVILVAALICVSFLTGCASVPMAPTEQDIAFKAFPQPTTDRSGLYIFRNSSVGPILKKNIYVDGVLLGETAPYTYFYTEISPGKHQISTESEFSDNEISFQAEGGKNYFCHQYIKWGVFVGGANVTMVSEEDGMNGVGECGLAK